MCPSLLVQNARGKLQLSHLTKPNDEKELKRELRKSFDVWNFRFDKLELDRD